MFQLLRKILHLDTIEDKFIQYQHSKEELELKKSELNELVEEYQNNSQNYLRNKSQLQDDIKKGISDSEYLWNKIDERFQGYLKSYLNDVSEIKKSIEKEQLNLNDLLKDERLVNLIEKSEKLEAFEKIKQGFRKGLVNRDLFHKAQLEVEDYLEKGIKKKTKYADAIVRNNDGKILFLKRTNNSGFEPSKFGLPGGHVDLGEKFIDAVKRELEEETGLKAIQAHYLHTYEDDNCEIQYFECFVEKVNPFHQDIDSQIILDSDEHINYCWLDKDEWQNVDLIMNLKDVLNNIFINDIEKNAIEVLKKAVEQGKIEESILNDIEKGSKLHHKYIRKEGSKYIYKEDGNKSKHINTLPLTEEQGRLLGGRINVEATDVLTRNEGASKEGEGIQGKRLGQIKLLEDLSKKNGHRHRKLFDWQEIPEDRRVIKEIKHKNPEKMALQHMIVSFINSNYAQNREFKIEKDNVIVITDKDELGEITGVYKYKFDPQEKDFKQVIEDNNEEIQKSIDIVLKALNEYNNIEKAHKYIRKEPDGKGGWNYIYKEGGVNNSKDLTDKQNKLLHYFEDFDISNVDKKDIFTFVEKLAELNSTAGKGLFGAKQIGNNLIYSIKNKVIKDLTDYFIENNLNIKAKDDIIYFINDKNKQISFHVREKYRFDEISKEVEWDNIENSFMYKDEDIKKVKELELEKWNSLNDSLKEFYSMMEEKIIKYFKASKKRREDAKINDIELFKKKLKDYIKNPVSNLYSYSGKITFLKPQDIFNNFKDSQYAFWDNLNNNTSGTHIQNIEYPFRELVDAIIYKYENEKSKYLKDEYKNDNIEKAHKYIRKEPDGKGCWNYIYKENKNESKVKDEDNFNNFIKNIKDYADKVIKGEKYIERLSHSEEQGRLLGGRRNVEYTLLIGRNERTNTENISEQQQKDRLRKFAKETGSYWKEDSFQSGNFVGRGAEAKVYRINGNYVSKTIDYSVLNETPLDFLDRISLHNYLFPETKYEILGIVDTKHEGFCFVVKQQFIKNSTNASREEIKKDMEKRGFEDLGGDMFINNDYIVEDLHEGNVLKSKNGTLLYVDPVVRLNTKDEGYGGKREFGEIKIEDNKIEKSEKQDYGVGKRQEQVEVHRGGKTFVRKQIVGHNQQEQKPEQPKQYSEDELRDHAKKAAQVDLERHIKEGGDETMRKVAHQELERRKNEEHVQGQEKNVKEGKEDVDKNTKENQHVEKFRTLSDEQVKFYLDASYPEVKEAAKMVADERGLNVVSKEDYIKQFEDYTYDESKKDSKEYGENKEKSFKKYEEDSNKLIGFKEAEVAINTYTGNGFVGIRFYLNDPENFDKNVKDWYKRTGRFITKMSLDDVKKISDELSEFINNNKIDSNLTLYRRVLVENGFFTKLKEGDIYSDKSFSSTSLKEMPHFGDFNIKILAKSGSRVSNVNNRGELEYLIDKDSQFRVIEKQKDGLGITVELL